MRRKLFFQLVITGILQAACAIPVNPSRIPQTSNPAQTPNLTNTPNPTQTPNSTQTLDFSSTQAPLSATPSAFLPPLATIQPTPASPFQSCQPDQLASEQILTTPFPTTLFSPAIPDPRPPLRKLAEARNFFIGTAAAPGYFADPAYVELLSQQFNMLTPETAMKWGIIHPEINRYDFSQGDALVEFARRYNMAVHAHVLVWDLQLPEWVTNGNFSRSEWINILCTHIKTVVGHYRGQVYAWDVVNEAVNTDGTLYNNFWLRTIGPEYIPMAFQWAREADPNARLFYNDNGGEGLNPKSQAIYALLRSLKADDIPIDGVGLQMHTALYNAPSPQALQSNMQRLADLGLELQITEMDVRLQYSDDSEAYKEAAQAEIYRQVISTCLAIKQCTALITWGLGDHYSWIPGWTGHPDAPLLFDVQGSPKPAYWAVHDALSAPSP
jgi:endo-1,4-beta-xylanase